MSERIHGIGAFRCALLAGGIFLLIVAAACLAAMWGGA